MPPRRTLTMRSPVSMRCFRVAMTGRPAPTVACTQETTRGELTTDTHVTAAVQAWTGQHLRQCLVYSAAGLRGLSTL